MELFAKTKMCRFFILGKCAKGPQCPYAHDKSELRDMPDLRCTKICNNLLQTGECNDKSCSFAHNHKELRSTTIQKTKLCRNLQFGPCPRGDKCSFAHSVADMHSPTTVKARRKLFPPAPASGYDGDDQSTQVSGGDSNSSDNGSVATSLNSMLEPAYVHIGAPMNKDQFSRQHAFRQPIALQEESLGDIFGPRDWSTDPMQKEQFSRQLAFRQPIALQEESLGDIFGPRDWSIDPMQSRMNLPFDSDPSLHEYMNALRQVVKDNAWRQHAVLSM